VDGVRFMALGPDGAVFATLTGRGQVVRLPDADRDGHADRVEVLASGLDHPHGITFHDGSLWVAETGRVIKWPGFQPGHTLGRPQVVVPDLPRGGGHFTRTIVFGPRDGMLYVAIGSSCNLCVERDRRRAAVVRYRPDGSGEEVFARGMRNAVGLEFRPGTDELWATNNERDWLGDDLPPEEIVNVLVRGGDYGWPYCYGDRVPNPEFASARRCAQTLPPLITDTAHSAPLGCAFYTGSQFPADYRGDFFVCYHGSWNRSVPTGYKVVRVRVRDGKPVAIEPFLQGFRHSGHVVGRPVDALVAADGALLISDDYAGRIYRVSYGR
jgi:glucose/arabinose dehydrogenase